MSSRVTDPEIVRQANSPKLATIPLVENRIVYRKDMNTKRQKFSHFLFRR